MTTSSESNPEFKAKVLGTINNASAKLSTPYLAFPLTVFLNSFFKCSAAAISKAPAPGTTLLSRKAF